MDIKGWYNYVCFSFNKFLSSVIFGLTRVVKLESDNDFVCIRWNFVIIGQGNISKPKPNMQKLNIFS